MFRWLLSVVSLVGLAALASKLGWTSETVLLVWGGLAVVLLLLSGAALRITSAHDDARESDVPERMDQRHDPIYRTEVSPVADFNTLLEILRCLAYAPEIERVRTLDWQRDVARYELSLPTLPPGPEVVAALVQRLVGEVAAPVEVVATHYYADVRN